MLGNDANKIAIFDVMFHKDEGNQRCGPKIHGLWTSSALSQEQSQLTYFKGNKQCWKLKTNKIINKQKDIISCGGEI